MLSRCGQSGPIVAGIIEIGAADDDHVAKSGANRVNLRIEFVLAVVASATVVLEIIRVRKLVGTDDAMRDADLLGDASGVFEFTACHARAVGGDGYRRVAEREIRGLCHDSAVHAAGERDHDSTHLAQCAQQAIVLGQKVRR